MWRLVLLIKKNFNNCDNPDLPFDHWNICWYISWPALVVKYQQKSQKWKYTTFIDVAWWDTWLKCNIMWSFQHMLIYFQTKFGQRRTNRSRNMTFINVMWHEMWLWHNILRSLKQFLIHLFTKFGHCRASRNENTQNFLDVRWHGTWLWRDYYMINLWSLLYFGILTDQIWSL